MALYVFTCAECSFSSRIKTKKTKTPYVYLLKCYICMVNYENATYSAIFYQKNEDKIANINNIRSLFFLINYFRGKSLLES